MEDKIEISKEELKSLLVAASRESCKYKELSEENELWEYHCCDYNRLVKEIAERVKEEEFEDQEFNNFIKSIITKG